MSIYSDIEEGPARDDDESLRLLKQLLKNYINGGNDGYGALHHEIRNGHMKTVKWLIDTGADINQRDKRGITPLSIACDNGYTMAIFYIISRANANVNNIDSIGFTPLMWAAAHGHLEAVKMLILMRGNEIDYTAVDNDEKKTAAELAREGGYKAIVDEIQYGNLKKNSDTSLSLKI